jgi:hypothetical protein
MRDKNQGLCDRLQIRGPYSQQVENALDELRGMGFVSAEAFKFRR